MIEYRDWWLEQLQSEKSELNALLETAWQEATACLVEDTKPVSGLALALWTFPSQKLQVVSYSLNPPDLQTLCQTWTSYTNSISALCQPVLPALPKEPIAPGKFAAVYHTLVELYDLQTEESVRYTVSVDFGDGGSYVALDKETLLCLGAAPASSAVYELDLALVQLTPQPPLHRARAAAGVAKTADFVYVFGGCDASCNEMNSCEKYSIADKQVLPLGNMQYRRSRFTPCVFQSLIYLVCAYPRTLESFSPETEIFAVLPLSLPSHLKMGASVAFVVSGELCLLTAGKQMARCKLASENEFRLSNTERYCGSTQPLLVVGSLVLIANKGNVWKFNLETHTFR